MSRFMLQDAIFRFSTDIGIADVTFKNDLVVVFINDTQAGQAYTYSGLTPTTTLAESFLRQALHSYRPNGKVVKMEDRRKPWEKI